MIAANEMTVNDQHYNSVFVATNQESINRYLDWAKSHYEVKGNRIIARKDEIHLQHYRDHVLHKNK